LAQLGGVLKSQGLRAFQTDMAGRADPHIVDFKCDGRLYLNQTKAMPVNALMQKPANPIGFTGPTALFLTA